MAYKHSEIPSLCKNGARVRIVQGRVVAEKVPNGFKPVKTRSVAERVAANETKAAEIDARAAAIDARVKEVEKKPAGGGR